MTAGVPGALRSLPGEKTGEKMVTKPFLLSPLSSSKREEKNMYSCYIRGGKMEVFYISLSYKAVLARVL